MPQTAKFTNGSTVKQLPSLRLIERDNEVMHETVRTIGDPFYHFLVVV